MQTLSWRWSALHLHRRSACMGGCLGGYVRATAPLPTETTPSNSRAFKKKSRPSSSAVRSSSSQQQPDQFWMSNSHEMDSDNRIMFHSKPAHDINHNMHRQEPSFENHALKDWHKQRQEWVGRQKPGQRGRREPVIKWSSTYEELLGTSRPFTQRVPLPEMVDFLVDVWEQEGLYG